MHQTTLCYLLLITASMLYSIVIPTVHADEDVIGIDVCYCAPPVFSFTFNFGLSCEDSSFDLSQQSSHPGLESAACQIQVQGEEDGGSLVPTEISTVQILEFDQSLDVIAQTVFGGPFLDAGDSTVTYETLVQTEPGTITDTPTFLPRALQITITALNAEGIRLGFVATLLYNLQCGVSSVIDVGDQIGWIVFTDVKDASDTFCPLTEAPSSSPSLLPSSAPTSEPPAAGDDCNDILCIIGKLLLLLCGLL